MKHKLFVADVFTVKRRLRDYRREIGSKTEIIQKEGLFGRSGKVVLTAIAMYVFMRILQLGRFPRLISSFAETPVIFCAS